jgi:Rrf2 family transcriptional regulator, nitric oxide-sensitive transcriptional repressor
MLSIGQPPIPCIRLATDSREGLGVISQTAEYALRAMTCLAEVYGNALTTSEIAEKTGTPFGYLVKIMARLSHANLVTARRGRNGGFVLSSNPVNISMLDVLQITDPNIRNLCDQRQASPVPKRDRLQSHVRTGCDRGLDYWQRIPLAKLVRTKRGSKHPETARPAGL